MAWNRSRAKYGNRKVVVDGITFDSKKEAQREHTNEIYEKGPNKGRFKPGKLLERKCSYIADFVYWDGFEMVVEDTKGMRTKEYIIKRKLMLYKYGIRIKEV